MARAVIVVEFYRRFHALDGLRFGAFSSDCRTCAPAGPNPGDYALWAWHTTTTNPQPLLIGGVRIGCIVDPTPLTDGSPQPIRCLRSPAIPSADCAGAHEIASPPGAPWTIVRNAGLAHAGTFQVQAILADVGAANATGFSATNAVTLRVQ
ncbi:MAG: hypothetical protein HYR85_20930 [Planctomycetes bacterium]|nr:hypothetical protein [Planctomycetota bacterium]MBI3844902.1 hypothetical protein [Planctomycetota bacterium]